MSGPLPQLHVGHGTTVGALTVFPVWVDAPRVTGLDWRASSIRVAEREGSPVVSELVLHNTVERPVVALEGDLLRGGWQDRMLARSLLLAPREARVVDALCVEHGRWSGTRQHDARGRRSAMSVRHGNAGDDRQGEVWRRIGRYDTALGATASGSMLDHLDRSESIVLRPLDGQRGVIIGIGGRVVGGELFGSITGLRARWQGLLDAAALDARLAPPVPTPAARARSFARRLGALEFDADDAGLARGIRSRDAGGQMRVQASGIALAVDSIFDEPDLQRLIHLTAFDNTHPLLENA